MQHDIRGIRRINFGAGNRPIYGWENTDLVDGPGIDWQMNLDGFFAAGCDDDIYDELAAVHVIEHLKDPLAFMYSAWLMAKPDARMTIICPHGSSDAAWEDPTHVRPFFEQSFAYFGQPWHWMNPQSGYRGDWKIDRLFLVVDDDDFHDSDIMAHLIRHERNWCHFMHVELRAVKPARDKSPDLMDEMHATAISLSDYWIVDDGAFVKFHRDPRLVFDANGELIPWDS